MKRLELSASYALFLSSTIFPPCQVTMSGESNNIKYSVEPQQIDLGATLYNKTVERDLVISNNGKVPYDFNVNTSRLSRPSIIEPTPRSGVVGPGQKETVKLKVRYIDGWGGTGTGPVCRLHYRQSQWGSTQRCASVGGVD